MRNRLPNTGRLPEKYTQFKLEYIDEYADNMEEVILAYGDTVVLLKKQKIPTKNIDKTGLVGRQGRLGSRREEIATPIENTESNFLRPEDTLQINIPALVETSPTLERREKYGIKEMATGLVTLSTKWLKKNNIVIDFAEDLFLYKDNQYNITSPDFTGNFLDSVGVLTYSIKKV
jgi:hypothetical protein